MATKKKTKTPTTETGFECDPFATGLDGFEATGKATVRVGMFFRRKPEEADKTFLRGDIVRGGVLAAFVGDPKNPKPNNWARAVVQFSGPRRLKDGKGWSRGSLKTTSAFKLVCPKCGEFYSNFGELKKKVLENNPESTAKKAHEIFDGLGNICPKCGTALTGWEQIDPFGPVGEKIYGKKVLDSFREAILKADGDLNIPPVVAYITGGTPGDTSRLPTTYTEQLDQAAEKCAEFGLQCVNFNALTDEERREDVEDVDFVYVGDYVVGCCGYDDLDAGFSVDGNYSVNLCLKLEKALHNEAFKWPNSSKPKAVKPKGGFHF